MAQGDAAATTEDALVLEITRRLKAPREAVFRAWTEPEALSAWMGPEGVQARDVTLDLRVGGGYSLVMDGKDHDEHALSGVYKEIVPPERLVFTFVWGQGDLKGLEMLVTLTLAEVEGGTLMTLVQERIPRETARQAHNQGWTSTLGCLEAYLAA